jgi:hypothetical protein
MQEQLPPSQNVVPGPVVPFLDDKEQYSGICAAYSYMGEATTLSHGSAEEV